MLASIWKQQPGRGWLLLSTQLFVVVTIPHITREASKLAGSLGAMEVPGENGVAMQLEAHSIAKLCFELLFFSPEDFKLQNTVNQG